MSGLNSKLLTLFIVELVVLFPIVNALSIYDVTIQTEGESATINFKVDVAANATITYGLYNQLNNILISPEKKNQHTFNLAGLSSATNYYYGIIAQYNSSGNSYEETKIGSFVTKDIIAPEKITGLKNISVGRKFIEIKWNESSATDFLKYALYRDDSNIFNITARAITRHLDQNLEAGKSYKYQISAMDLAGNEGLKSDALNVKTNEPDINAPVISNVTLEQVSSTSATISWKTNEESNSTLYYGTATSMSSFAADSNKVKEHRLIISSLSDKVLYYFRVQSCDESNNCDVSPNDDFVAGGDNTPPLLEGIEVPQYSSSTNVMIRGKTEPLTELKFFVNEVYKAILPRTSLADGNIKSYTISGFNEGKNKLKILAEDGAGNKNEKEFKVIVDTAPPTYEIGDIKKFVTEETLTINGSVNELSIIIFFVTKPKKIDAVVPSKVTGLKNKTIGKTSVELVWDANEEKDFKTFLIYKNGALITETDYNKFSDPGLDSNKDYTYEIAAVDNACNIGEKSAPLKIHTEPNGTILNESIEPNQFGVTLGWLF